MGRPRTPANAVAFFVAGTTVFAAETAASDTTAPPAGATYCPDDAAVWNSATALVPSAAAVLRAARPRVTITDLGDRYVVRVLTDDGPLERVVVDPARECDKRTRFVAEFIVLALLPPTAALEPAPPPSAPDTTTRPTTSSTPASASPSSSTPAPASPPQPPPARALPPAPPPASAPPPSIASTRTSPEAPLRDLRFGLELGATAQGAPALLGAFPVGDWGGEGRLRLGAGPWTAVVAASTLPAVTFTARGDRVDLWRVPLEAGVRANLGAAWATFAADATLALAYEQYTGESTHAPQSASRWSPGVSTSATAWAPSIGGFALYLRLSCSLYPFAQSLIFLPDTNPPKTPSLWFGASAGIAYER